MHFLQEKINSLNIGWNKRPLTESDIYRLCARYKVKLEEIPLRVSGFYYCLMGRHFIAVNSDLPSQQKLFVMFHEFAHFLFHTPDGGATANFHGIGRKTRKESEADLFALVALIPQNMLAERTAAELIEDGFEAEMVRDRLKVFEKHSI